ncbi:hypothetical protein BIV60_23420 [Bacillus sp. MUM 116]|uniref:hypothetical protein n=1 Tax=Bacillus sp. MUM 116 TaxID=1678002 RepID=UPI0008F58119|nr:hypothetical protein [Bacillus sp. MUM 116]OIK09643.1 hypothetical protein BIV60_23420 [Bacillus sp. MUM 116]
MKSLQDALYNWLTIKVVSDSRPDDTAAKETVDLFEEILVSDYRLSNIVITTDEVMYYVTFHQDGESKKQRFPREVIEVMLDQINGEPDKYCNFPAEEE